MYLISCGDNKTPIFEIADKLSVRIQDIEPILKKLEKKKIINFFLIKLKNHFFTY